MTIVLFNRTTSEYIQASSRVGREQEKPGLVLTHLSHTKLRDRSHYEKFSSYHQNLYKYVEPTSVTSHSDPVRKRCLHAIVIFLVRFWSKKHRKIPLMPDEKLMQKIKDYIIKHVEKSDGAVRSARVVPHPAPNMPKTSSQNRFRGCPELLPHQKQSILRCL